MLIDYLAQGQPLTYMYYMCNRVNKLNRFRYILVPKHWNILEDKKYRTHEIKDIFPNRIV